MILVEMGEISFEGGDARLVGDWVRRRIANWGFEEFCITFGPDCEIEWTDPDLFLEWTDIYYFIEIGVPEAFVRRVFINWQVYVQTLRGVPFPKLGTSETEDSEDRRKGGAA